MFDGAGRSSEPQVVGYQSFWGETGECTAEWLGKSTNFFENQKGSAGVKKEKSKKQPVFLASKTRFS